MLSFWETKYFIEYDYIIIGSGIVGLSTACSIKGANPDKSVLVLERGILPTGASTKNAGFACYGSAAEILSDINTMGEEKALWLIEQRYQGLKLLRKRLGDENIGYQENGGGEMILHHEEFDISRIDYLNRLVKPIFKNDLFTHNDAKAKELGFNSSALKHYIVNNCEGQIDTGLMMRNLLALAGKLGVTVITGAEVQYFEETNNSVEVNVYHAVLNKTVTFKTAKLAICTNAFTKKLLPHIDLEPGRGQVIVTKPIEGLKFKGIFHLDEGYYYFRNYGNRILFGGGRNLDFEGENTDKFEYNPTIINKLKQHLTELIIPNTPFEVEQEWTGIMAFGKQKLPVIEQVTNKVVAGVRLNGMGIALGSLVGKQLSDMLLSD